MRIVRRHGAQADQCGEAGSIRVNVGGHIPQSVGIGVDGSSGVEGQRIQGVDDYMRVKVKELTGQK